MRRHGGGVDYRGVLRVRRGIQAGLPRVQELLLLEHQSRFLVRMAAVRLRELLLEEDFRLGLGRLVLHGMVCLIVVKGGLLCESLLLREEGRTCVVLGLSSDI